MEEIICKSLSSKVRDVQRRVHERELRDLDNLFNGNCGVRCACL